MICMSGMEDKVGQDTLAVGRVFEARTEHDNSDLNLAAHQIVYSIIQSCSRLSGEAIEMVIWHDQRTV